jgi:LPS O-antigen subunit length determinant protein (WzzB/FepE family)
MEQSDPSNEIGIAEIVRFIWSGKVVIAGAMATALAVGVLLYLFLPRTYASVVEITPLPQSQLADYIALSEEKVFPYTAAMLFSDYIENLRDFDLLARIATETGVVKRDNLSEEEFAEEVRKFVGSVDFKREVPAGSQVPTAVSMKASGKDIKALAAFSSEALTSAWKNTRDDLSTEIRDRANSITERDALEIAMLKVEIGAARRREESARNDKIADLSEQAKIARSLGMEKPLEMRILDAKGAGGSVQINSGQEQKPYLRGFAALELEEKTLQGRKDNDPFVTDLRKLQQKVAILENNPRPGKILSLLKASPLGDSNTAKFARYSFSAASAYKTFPRASIFIPASLLIGFVLGLGILVVRGVSAR